MSIPSIVSASPIFLGSARKTVVGQFGRNQTLDCLVGGKPTPTVTWYKSSPHGCFKNGSSSLGNNTISFGSLSPTDTGTYKCVASNPYGTIEKEVTLTAQGKNSMHLLIHFYNIYGATCTKTLHERRSSTPLI